MATAGKADSDRALIIKWEIAGFLAITLLGTLLHFLYDWLGHWKPIALVAAVNESVWEHLKMAFWPTLAFYAVELAVLRSRIENPVLAATAALYLAPATIIILFYSYTSILGRHVVAVDIIIFLGAIAASQLLHYRLVVRRPMATPVLWPSLLLLLAIIAAFSLLTFHPPDLPLFRDPTTGRRGLP